MRRRELIILLGGAGHRVAAHQPRAAERDAGDRLPRRHLPIVFNANISQSILARTDEVIE
jgi:hypothetical protein